jgi:cyclopropane-fatty-acyl-phospholipid synthase
MGETAARPASAGAVDATLDFLGELWAGYPRDFAVRLWDGTVLEPVDGAEPRFTLVLRHSGALRAMFWPPGELTLSDAYLYDDFDVEGDLEAVFPLADHLLLEGGGIAERLRRIRRLRALPAERRPRVGRERAHVRGRRSSLERDRQAIAYHYELPAEFYALWLDRTMAYSCAVFESPDEDLDTAQRRKLDYVCRKLRLRPGERLLDVGCGWGGLIIHASGGFGVDALGVTLSHGQAEVASARIREAGLAERCRVERRDYREVDEPEGFDKLVSVGMYEHVAEAALPEYFRDTWRLLKPGGVFLAHGMAIFPGTAPRAGASFMNTYVFPDYELVPVSTMLRAAEEAGFEVRDVESLREHYVLTMRHWLRRLEAGRERAIALTNEPTYRVWRLTLAGCAYGFASGRMNVYQALLAKPDRGVTGLPLSRADWYA